MRTLASDNYASVHPEVMKALMECNSSHAKSYGDDSYTWSANEQFRLLFGDDTSVFFVYNGTGANVLGLKALTLSFQAILCSELAHINVDESTAPENFLGCKVIPIPTHDGKILPDEVERRIIRMGDQHHPQMKVVSISQPTEYGTVYTLEELKALSSMAKKYGLFFHMDGARISNAAISLDLTFKEFTRNVGVDVLSFGGTKNGLMFGEAVLTFGQLGTANFPFYRKQAMQLHSKMRYISAQFVALLSNDLWRKNAQHANEMAKLLAAELVHIPTITITQSVDANAVFAILPKSITPQLQAHTFFYVWNELRNEVRLMCSHDTQESDIKSFVKELKRLIESA